MTHKQAFPAAKKLSSEIHENFAKAQTFAKPGFVHYARLESLTGRN